MSESQSANSGAQDAAGSDAERIDAARREAETVRELNAAPESITLSSPGGGGTPFAGLPPDSFPGYELVREINRGGQGVVYQAIQKSTRRKVAIKVMKEGPFAGASDKARFDREVRILAQLNHPHIVTIHDSGEAAGHFFFVMDYIGGQSLDVYAASGERSIEEALQLFAKICDAVNAAHLRGIIHRDLKPGNICIDPDGNPHILDFGLAKLSVGEATDATHPPVLSITGQFIGSLPWASPEQAEGILGNIDVRTDVYSLGVILYQMLTGQFPYEVIGKMRDVLARIMKTEPARPSTIRRRINDEVETILLKCLSKNRDRRYQNAGELGREIGHYLAGEPIEAKRDSAWYVLRKQLQRHKVAALVAGAFTLVLIAFAVTSSIQADRNRRLAYDARERLSEAMVERGVRLLDSDDNLGLLYLLEARTLVEHNPQLKDARAGLWAAWHQGLEGRLVRVIAGPDPFSDMRFSPDSRQLITAEKNTVTTWDIATGKRVGEPIKVGADLVIQGFLGDGNILRTVDMKARTNPYWDMAAGKPRHATPVTDRSLVVSPNGKWQFEHTDDGTACVRDVLTGEIRGKPWNFTGGMWEVAFSPDGRYLTTRSADKIWLWNVTTGESWGESFPIDGACTEVNFSPYGQSFMAARKLEEQISVMHVDLATGECHGKLLPIGGDGPSKCNGDPPPFFVPDGSVPAIISPDGKWQFEHFVDGTACVRDVLNGEIRGKPWNYKGLMSEPVFSPDGRFLATQSVDKKTLLWNVTTGESWGKSFPIDGAGTIVSFSPDGRLLAVRTMEQNVGVGILVDLATEERHGKPLLIGGGDPGNWYGEPPLFSPDGSVLAKKTGDKVYLWNVESTDSLGPPIAHGTRIVQVFFSPDGRLLATTGFDYAVRLWDIPSGKPHGTPLRHQRGVPNIQFSPDGLLLATLVAPNLGEGQVRLWRTGVGEPGEQALPHSTPVTALAFNDNGNGKLLVTSSRDGTVQITDLETMQPHGTPIEHTTAVRSVALSPDGKRLATCGGEPPEVRFWDTSTGNRVGDSIPLDPINPRQYPIALAFSPDGRLLAGLSTRDYKGTIDLWETATGQPRGEPLQVPQQMETSWFRLRFSTSGDRIFAGEAFGTWTAWEVATGQRVSPVDSFVDGFLVAVSPDGRRMAVLTQSKGLRLYDSTRGEYYGAPNLADGSAVFSADGSRIAVSAGKSAGLWSGIDGTPMGAQIQFPTLSLHPALSPDGRLLAAKFDENVRLWETTTGQPYGPGRRVKRMILDVSFSPDGRWLVTWSDEGYRLFRLPNPPADFREMQLRTWVELGARLNAQGDLETIPAAESQSLQEELAASD